MGEEVAERVWGVIHEAANGSTEDRASVADAVGLCVIALALGSEANAQRAGSSELRSRMCEAFEDAMLEVKLLLYLIISCQHLDDSFPGSF